MNRNSLIKAYKWFIGITYPITLAASIWLLHIGVSLAGMVSSGYDFGDHPVGGWHFEKLTVIAFVIVWAVSLLLTVIITLFTAIFVVILGHTIRLGDACRKVYKTLFLVCYPIFILIPFWVLAAWF